MKMTKKYDKLNDTFNVEGEVISLENSDAIEKIEKIEKISTNVDDVKKDYEYTRGNLYSLSLMSSRINRRASSKVRPLSRALR